MAIQTAYPSQLAIGRAGMIADMRSRTVVSREVAMTSAAIAFGSIVLRGVTDHTCMAFGTSGAGGFLGIAVMDRTVSPESGDSYLPGDTAGVVRAGVVWVTAAQACTPGQAVYFDGSGNFTNVATGATPILGATFETTASAGAPAIVRLVN